MHGETEVASLCQHFDPDSWHAVIQAYRQHRDSGGKDIAEELREQFVVVNTIPIASTESERGFWTTKKVAAVHIFK